MDESNRRARLFSAIGLRVEEDPVALEDAIVKTNSVVGFVPTVRRETGGKPPARQRGMHGPRLLSTRRRTHGTRRRAGARAVRRAAATRAGPGDDGSGSSGGVGDSPRDLFADLKNYLTRVGPQGAERGWLVDQVAYLGHDPQRVSAALALLTSEGKARRGVGQHDADVVWGRS